MNWLIYLGTGAVAGWLGSILIGANLGLIGNIIAGIVGSIVGSYLLGSKVSNMVGGGFLGVILTAAIGAAIVLFIISLIKRV